MKTLKEQAKTLRQLAANYGWMLVLLLVAAILFQNCIIRNQSDAIHTYEYALTVYEQFISATSDNGESTSDPDTGSAEDEWCIATTDSVYTNSDGYAFIVRAGEQYNSRLWKYVCDASCTVYVNNKPFTYEQFLTMPFGQFGTNYADGKGRVPVIEMELTDSERVEKYPEYYNNSIINMTNKKGRLDELNAQIATLEAQKAELESSIAKLSAKRDALTPASTYSEIRKISVALSTASRQYAQVVITLAKALEERDYCEASFERSKSDLGTTDTLWIVVNRKTCEVQNWSWPSHIECEPSDVNFVDKKLTGIIEGPDRRVYGTFTLSFEDVDF